MAIVIFSVLICLALAAKVLNGMVLAHEPRACKDAGDAKALMARLPGEPHGLETCIYFIRYGDREWVPALGTPIIYNAGVKGKPGLEQQLGYVRTECRRLAAQLKQRC